MITIGRGAETTAVGLPTAGRDGRRQLHAATVRQRLVRLRRKRLRRLRLRQLRRLGPTQSVLCPTPNTWAGGSKATSCRPWSPPAPTARCCPGRRLGQSGTSVLLVAESMASHAVGRAHRRRLVARSHDAHRRRILWTGHHHGQLQPSVERQPDPGAAFLNLANGTESAYVVAYPATGGTAGHATSGSIQVSETSSFLGAGIHALQNLSCVNCCARRPVPLGLALRLPLLAAGREPVDQRFPDAHTPPSRHPRHQVRRLQDSQ